MSTEADLKNADKWHHIAVVFGYNELVKLANTLGEKVYFRLARDHAEEEAAKVGAKVNRNVLGTVVLELTSKPPSIIFHERDIELMRQAVAAFDQAHASPAAAPGPQGGPATPLEHRGTPHLFVASEEDDLCLLAVCRGLESDPIHRVAVAHGLATGEAPAPTTRPTIDAAALERIVIRWRNEAKRRPSDIGLDQALCGAIKDGIVAAHTTGALSLPDDWQPTAQNVNALPAPLFRYVSGIETNADPGGKVRDNIRLKDENAALSLALAEATAGFVAMATGEAPRGDDAFVDDGPDCQDGVHIPGCRKYVAPAAPPLAPVRRGHCVRCFGRGVRLWSEDGAPRSEDPCSTCGGTGHATPTSSPTAADSGTP